MSNNLSKLLVPSRINLLVERAFRGHEFLEGPVLDDVPLIQVDDVVGRLQVAEVVRDADGRRVFRKLVERFLERSRDGVVQPRGRLVEEVDRAALEGFPVFTESARAGPVLDRLLILNRASWVRKTNL